MVKQEEGKGIQKEMSPIFPSSVAKTQKMLF